MAKSLIKPSHEGRLHEVLGIPKDRPIPFAEKLKAKHSKNPAIRKMGNFALNFSGGKK